jgi:hypothetical protein
MRRDLRAYLWDIEQAAGNIQDFTQGKQLSDYQQDAMLRAAVERCFERMGEALSQALRSFPEIAGRITNEQQIKVRRSAEGSRKQQVISNKPSNWRATRLLLVFQSLRRVRMENPNEAPPQTDEEVAPPSRRLSCGRLAHSGFRSCSRDGCTDSRRDAGATSRRPLGQNVDSFTSTF